MLRPFGLFVFTAITLLCQVLHAGTSSQDSSVRSMMTDLASDDYAIRQHASHEIEVAFANETLAFASIQDMEARMKLGETLEFEDGLIRWAQEAMKIPDEQRTCQLQLLSHTGMMQLMSKTFSTSPLLRMEAVPELAKLNYPGIDDLLVRMIDDSQRGVSVAAMEAVWDRKPTERVVDALFRRAVLSGIGNTRPTTTAEGTLSFRGRKLVGPMFRPTAIATTTDNDIATEVLLHLNSPRVVTNAVTALRQIATFVDVPEVTKEQLRTYVGYNIFLTNTFMLIEQSKPTDAIAPLLKIACCRISVTAPIVQNGTKYYYSNRTAAMAELISISGQRLNDYRLIEIESNSHPLWVFLTLADEEAAVQKLQAWHLKSKD